MTTPLQAPDSAGMATALARDYAVQIDTNWGTPSQGTPNWVFVLGLNTVNPTQDITFQDDGDIHSGGYKSQQATAIGANLELAGLRKGLKSPGYVADPGQEKLRSHGSQIGDANTAHIRYWRTDEIDEAREGYYAVNWTSAGGDKEGLYGFTATCTGKGKPKDITKPVAPVTYTFELPGATTGGTWTITVDGNTTAGVSNSVTAAALKTAVEALPNVGTGNATVTLTGGVYSVTFSVAVTTVTASGASLTPAGTVTVGTTP
ncbi:phage tail tube protein [Nocardia asteroides]|uniref:phage tail tube protein n=1 Tax=Nocardia asteroides TaxID=1824 RepID=UPI0033D74183